MIYINIIDMIDIINFSILLCEDAFKEEKYLEEKFRDNNVRILNKKEASGFSIEDNNKLYICWRGLYELKDTFNNLKKFNKENLLFNNKVCGKVNGYVFKYYSLLRKDTIEIVNDYLKKNGEKKKQIYFIGYSLGASILLSALEIKLLLNDSNIEINTLTFGSPKIGDRNFTKVFNETIIKSLRIYDDNDIVCKYPKENDYFHVENGFKLRNRKEKCLFQLFLDNINKICLKRNNIMKEIKFYILSMNNNNKQNDNKYIKIHTVENYKNKII